MPSRRSTFIGVSLIWASLLSIASATPPNLEHLRASKLGIDGDGNLWAWDAVANRVTRFPQAGATSQSGALPPSTSVDVAPDARIAMLANNGATVQVRKWSGDLLQQFPLANAAGDIAWVGESSIAITPKYSDHVVEVWDIAHRTITRKMGPAEDVLRTPGKVVFGHAIHVRFNPRAKEIVTLDARSGEFAAFFADGTNSRRAIVTPHDDPSLQQWIEEQSRKAAASKSSPTPMLWTYSSLALREDGTATFVYERHAGNGTVDLVTIDAKGTVKHEEVTVKTCVTSRVQPWIGNLIFYSDTRSPQPACVEVRREP